MKPDLSLGPYVPGAAVSTERRSVVSVLADFIELCKPRIASFVFLASFTGGLLAAGPDSGVMSALLAALFVTLVAGASGVFNQVLERDLDRLMPRTQNRPLPSGRISPRAAIPFAAFLAIVGVAGLGVAYSLLSAFLALATLAAYALVYTPLKRYSSLNTVVGAIPGAMPPLLGYVALAGETGAWGWMLFGILFAWQFPHFLAIAWLYREDYRRAGMLMLPCLPGSEGVAGRQALLYALVLLPVSLLPGVRGDAGITYTLGALFLGILYVVASAAFAWRETPTRARAVLFVSLFYLPLLFTLTLSDPVVSLVLGN